MNSVYSVSAALLFSDSVLLQSNEVNIITWKEYGRYPRSKEWTTVLLSTRLTGNPYRSFLPSFLF